MQLSHVGACTDLSVVEKKSDCPKQCDIDDEDGDEVVCGSDGNVYRSGRGYSQAPLRYNVLNVKLTISSVFAGRCASSA